MPGIPVAPGIPAPVGPTAPSGLPPGALWYYPDGSGNNVVYVY